MRISGFTIARNAVALGYPLAESIRSLLPLVDEYLVGVGDCDDGTWEVVQEIGDARIHAFRSIWDLSKRAGLTLSEETNKALARCTGAWAVYLQADEVLHENELPALRAALARYADSRVEGLSFSYFHFYGGYGTIQDHPGRFYRRATRAVKTGIGIASVGDACGFRVLDGGRSRRVRRRNIGVHVYHYGHVRPPAVMWRKQREFVRLYDDSPEAPAALPAQPADAARAVYGGTGHLEYFRGTHPAVMHARMAAQDWEFDPRIDQQPPRWLRRARIFLTWPIHDTLRTTWHRFK